MGIMDENLKEAALSGDIEFLKKAFDENQNDLSSYFLSYYSPKKDEKAEGNIFHLAVWNGEINFIREAMKLLPIEIVVKLISQQNNHNWNLLHVAVLRSNSDGIKVILNYYKSGSGENLRLIGKEKPWLALSNSKTTPFQMVLSMAKKTEDNEECALAILSMESVESFCNVVDFYMNSPLFFAVKNGFNRVAERILNSSSSYTVTSENGSTPLHFAPNSSENVLRLLLEKHADMIDKIDEKTGYNVVHQWAELNQIWPFKFLMEHGLTLASSKIFTDLINRTTEKKNGDNPLHTVARLSGHIEIGRQLVEGYQLQPQIKATNTHEIESLNCCPPWEAKNKNGKTPLIVAISSNNEDLALYFLSIDPKIGQIYDADGKSPFLLAVANSCVLVVETILQFHQPHLNDLRDYGRTTVLHMVRKCPESIGKRIVEKFWWMMNLVDEKGKKALDYAKEENVLWLIKLLKEPISIHKEPFDWVAACHKDETIWAVVAFIDTCPDLQIICRAKHDTPLHHIRFKTYKEYVELLKKPSIAEILNTSNSNGATPLHRALEKKDIRLAKALLTDNRVDRNIEDRNGITTMALLSKLYREDYDWELMCIEIKVHPHVNTTYVDQHRTDLDQMRNTLSVVAALLATITFAAAFTLPGGLKQESGYAMLAKKLSFIVFLLADVYAMCTSMLVLFCLIWSMVCEDDMSYLLVDRSVSILMQSLYGTMVAFMTGIYTVINHSTLWLAIIIIGVCSVIGILMNRTVMHFLITLIFPELKRKHKDRSADSGKQNGKRTISHQNQDQKEDCCLGLLEEGKASTSGHEI